MGYLTKTSKYPYRLILSDLTHMMSIVDLMIAVVEMMNSIMCIFLSLLCDDFM